MANNDFDILLDKYWNYLKFERQVSINTLNNYQKQLQAITKILRAEQFNSWMQVDLYVVKFILSESKKQGLSASSIALRLSALRSFFNFLVNQNIIKLNPAKMINTPKQAKHLPKNIETEQIFNLLDIKQYDPLSIRDLAMMELMYSAGLRLSELQSLNLFDIDYSNKELTVIGKGNKQRMVPFGEKALQSIQDWLSVRNIFKPDTNQQALFLNNRGERISNRGIEQRMELWGKKKGLSARVHPHKLRHSFATDILEASSDIRAVQELLGHANLSTTQIYTHLNFKHLANVYDNAHPRAKRKKDK